MLHCGAEVISRDELGMLPIPPSKGSRHVIRPFIEDIELITNLLGRNGLSLKSEGYGVKHKEGVPAQFFGLMEVELEGDYLGRDYGLTIGLRGSYDQTLTRGMVVGSNIFVCDNLCFSGEIDIRTKQTTFIGQRIKTIMIDAVSRIPALAIRQDEKFTRYKEVDVGRDGVNDTIIEMVRDGTLNPSHVGKVLKEWDTPKHPEHAQYGHSVWRFHNAVTEAIKPTDQGRANVLNVMDRTIPLTLACDRLAA